MKLKFTVISILAVLLLFAGVCFWVKETLDQKIASSVQDVFPGSTVQFTSWQLKPFLEFKLNNLTIKSESLEISLPLIVAKASLSSIYHFKMDLVSVENPKILVKTLNPHFKLPETKPASESKAEKAFELKNLQIKNLDFTYTSQDLNIKAILSLALNVSNQTLEQADLNMSLLQAKDFKIQNLEARIPSSELGTLEIESMQYQKLKTPRIKGRLLVNKNEIQITNVQTELFQGQIEGHFAIHLKPGFPLTGTLEAKPIQLSAVLNNFELNKKIDAKALLIGTIKIEGLLGLVTNLSGSFRADDKGGDLVITDAEFLENLAKNTKQPLPIIEASFKEYHFDAGTLELKKEAQNLGLEIHLSGPKGRRDLNVQLHDVF